MSEKGRQRAEAVVRVIHGMGIDLRYLWNGDLRDSQLYRDDEQLQAAAAKMRDGLLARAGLVLARSCGGAECTGRWRGRWMRCISQFSAARL